jgi:hypothetical protein
MRNGKFTIESLNFLGLGNFQNCKFLENLIKMMCFNYNTKWWWIEGMHTNHMERKQSQNELKWISNGCSKLAIQEKF